MATHSAGYPQAVVEHRDEHEHESSWHESAQIAFVAVLLLIAWTGVVPRVHHLDLVALTGVLVGGFPIFRVKRFAARIGTAGLHTLLLSGAKKQNGTGF